MKRIIGIQTKKKPPPPTIEDTLDTVDKHAANIDKKVNQCDNELRRIHAQMKSMCESGGKNILREKAKKVLERRKQYEIMSGNIHQQSFNMEQATSAIQSAKANQLIFAAMKDGAKEMKKVYKNLKVEEIDAFQDEMEDIYETADDIQEALGRNYNTPDIDESQLEAELEAIGDAMVEDDDKSYLDQAIQGPAIPVSTDGFKISVPDNSPIAPPKPTSPPKTNAEGIAIDEYGLPITPTKTEENPANK